MAYLNKLALKSSWITIFSKPSEESAQTSWFQDQVLGLTEKEWLQILPNAHRRAEVKRRAAWAHRSASLAYVAQSILKGP